MKSGRTASPSKPEVNRGAMSRPNAPKILIISSDTGGGHRSAATAIVAGVQKFWAGDSHAVRVVRAVEESHHLSAKMVSLYNWVLRHRQHWMKYVYWFVNRLRPESRGPLYRRSLRYIHDLFEQWCPHVVVSVHPLTQHAFARVLKELGLADKIPLVTVVTDPCYGFWKGWACDDVTLYLVASDEARQQLIDYGVRPERIKVSGMPVHPKFELPDELRGARVPRPHHRRRHDAADAAGVGRRHDAGAARRGRPAQSRHGHRPGRAPHGRRLALLRRPARGDGQP